MPKLLIKKSLGPATDFPLVEESYSFGRASDNQIILEGTGVSRHHGVLHRSGDNFVIRDLNSHNGVFINNVKVQESALNHGDQIRVGNYVLVYDEGSGNALLSPSPTTITLEESYEDLMSDLSSQSNLMARRLTDPSFMSQIQKERRTLALLYDLGRALSTVDSIDEISHKALQILLESTRAERGAIFLQNQERTSLLPAIVRDRQAGSTSGAEITLSSTVASRILSERKAVVTADAAADPRFASGKSVVLQGLRSIACAPLVGKGGTLGILYLENKHSVGAFTKEDLQLLSAVASQIGLAIENAQFFEALRRSNEELEQQVEERTEALRRTELKLYQSEKMASLSRLVAGVAHEFNTPLGALKANLELLMVLFGRLATREGRSPEDEKLLKHMLEIAQEGVSASGRIMSVVRSLSSFARLDEAEFKVADINEGLETVVRLLDPAARRRAEVLLTPGDIPPIRCYPALLNEAFMNLLNNACQAIKQNGQVFIETRRDAGDVVVSIRDTGSGIPREYHQKIFDPGFTTKGVGVGVGLGLAVAYSVIREHQGSIEVDSDVGKGATFTVRLPITTEELVASRE